MTEIEAFRKYEGTLKLRRDLGFEVHPEAEPFDGMRFRVRTGWRIEDDDSRYPGEYAMLVDFDQNWPLGFIASGDLVDLQPVPQG
ncbi:hypothetical protein [Rhizobium leguminosarum]|uniref:hypothetical protein n=1 Tax=Rhizobium leguminosarum TaxID=384 RepID=UPI001C93F8AB|nr:hypothetical protein [Rhizobium leguminosarum]MBY5821501.1 hypothetical protein [Rhizobium leguminosarum]